MFNSTALVSLLSTHKFTTAPFSRNIWILQFPGTVWLLPSLINLITDLAECFSTFLGHCSLLASFHFLDILGPMGNYFTRALEE